MLHSDVHMWQTSCMLLAKHIGCDEFYTFDADIKKIESHPKIDFVKIITG